MKQFRQFLTFLLVIFFGLTTQIQAAEFPEDIQRIIDKKTLVVAVLQQDAPPFFMQDKNGNLIGYDISLAQDLAHRLGVQTVFNRDAKTFDEVIDLLVKGKADIGISMLSITLPRALRISFSQPYLKMDKVLVLSRLQTAQRNLEVNTEQALTKIKDKSIRIGVLANSSYVHFAEQKYSNLTIIPYDKLSDAIQDVKSGKIFGVFFDKRRLPELLPQDSDSALYFRIITLKEDSDSIGIAIPWQDLHLLAWINLYLTTISTDGTSDRLAKTYLQGIS